MARRAVPLKHFRVRFVGGRSNRVYYTYILAKNAREAARLVMTNPPVVGAREVLQVEPIVTTAPPTRASVDRLLAKERARQREAAAGRRVEAERAEAERAERAAERPLTAEEEFERRFGFDHESGRRARRAR